MPLNTRKSDRLGVAVARSSDAKISSLIVIGLLVASLLPIQIVRNPAPISAAAVICPFLIDRQLVFSGWAGLVSLVGSYAILIGFGSSLYFDEFLPLLSAASFALPMSGFFLGAMYVKQPGFRQLFDRAIFLAGAFFALTLAFSLVENNLVVRVAVLSELSSGGYGYLLYAAADCFGYPWFGVRGVNTFAGICLSTCFLLILSFAGYEAQGLKAMRLLSLVTVLLFGLLLQSRAYFFGLVVFLLIAVVTQRLAWIKRVLLMVGIFGLSFLYVTFDSRLLDFFSSGSEIGFGQLTTNRSVLWGDFLHRWNPLFGSGFQRLDFDFSESHSYHNYFLSCAGKGGVLLMLSIAVVLAAPFLDRKKSVRRMGRFKLLIAMHASFIVQAMVWDIYATQCYGHVAWFVCGACLSGSPVGLTRLTENSRGKYRCQPSESPTLS